MFPDHGPSVVGLVNERIAGDEWMLMEQIVSSQSVCSVDGAGGHGDRVTRHIPGSIRNSDSGTCQQMTRATRARLT